MGTKGRSSEDGQILLVVATAFFFVLLGAAAATVDLGNGMLQQRRLQNITDAAAVAAVAELSRGGTIDTAKAVARDVVSSNSGGAFVLPATNTGAGTGLKSGIEVSVTPGVPSEVRVALQRPVQTYLAGAIGVKTITVGAQSRAGTRWQGILPVAVKRFSAGDTSMDISTDNPRRGDVWDFIANANTGTIGEWPSPLSASAALDTPSSPSDVAVPAADPRDNGRSDPCDQLYAGPVMPFVGHDSEANVANGSDFHFWVAPDIRNITSLSPDYFNSVTGVTSVQDLKNLEAVYFADGYPGVKQPAVGDELAAISGVNDEKTVQMMKKNHPWGSIVTAMLYDGTVYRKTDFNLTVPASVTTSARDTTAPNLNTSDDKASIPVQITPINGFAESVALSVEGLPTGTGPTDWNWEFDGGFLKVWQNSNRFEGAITIQVKAQSSTRLKTAATTVVAGNNPVFSVTAGESYKVASWGSSTQFALAFVSWNNYGPRNVHITGMSGSAAGWATAPSDWVTVKKSRPGWLPVTIDVPTGTSPGEYELIVTATDDNSPSQSAKIYLTLQVLQDPATNVSQTTSYVKVLGYANFAITYSGGRSTPTSADNNTIFACAISDIKSDPSLLTKGMVPRLLPWR